MKKTKKICTLLLLFVILILVKCKHTGSANGEDEISDSSNGSDTVKVIDSSQYKKSFYYRIIRKEQTQQKNFRTFVQVNDDPKIELTSLGSSAGFMDDTINYVRATVFCLPGVPVTVKLVFTLEEMNGTLIMSDTETDNFTDCSLGTVQVPAPFNFSISKRGIIRDSISESKKTGAFQMNVLWTFPINPDSVAIQKSRDSALLKR